MLSALILADAYAVQAAGIQKNGPLIRVESSRLIVRDMVFLRNDRRLVYPIKSGPSGFSKLRVNALGHADVSVKLLDSRNYSLYQAGSSFDFMPARSETIRNMRFFFDLPEAGTYYLIVGLEKKVSPRKVIIFASVIYEQTPEENSRLLGLYQHFYELVKESFLFPDFSVTVGGCGEENAFSVPDIFICYELLAGLPEEEHDYLALWVASHELGHNLLEAWGSPLWKNEEAADELGTVILSVTPYRQRVLQSVKRLLDERTPHRLISNKRWLLLLNRARKTTVWLAAPEGLRARWADFLKPHLRGEGPSVLRGCFPESDDELSPCTLDVMPAKAGTQCFQYIPDPLPRASRRESCQAGDDRH
jgi:hypothetical protein